MKSWRVSKYVRTIVLIALGTLVIALPASAQNPDQGINLQVSPLPISLSTKPGTTISTDLRIRNVGSLPEKLQIRLLKVSEDDNGAVHLTAPSSTDEWVKWVSFSRPTFDAPPGEWQTIKMNVAVPKSAAFGYYFAVEYLRATPEATQAGKAVTRGAVATFILLNADAPGGTREAEVVSFTANKKFYEFLPATFTVKLRAIGNIHVAPHGNIFISRGNKQVSVVNINANQGNILPNSSRFFESSWNDGFPVYAPKMSADQPVMDKMGKPVSMLKWDFSKANRLRFGHYTAHLVMVYDNGQRDVPIEATVSFWVIPWRLVLYVVAIIVGPALLVYLIMRRRFKKRLQKESKGYHASH